MTLYGSRGKTKQLDFQQFIDCPHCNRAGSLRAFKSYRWFTINFIPIFKYKKRWYLETTCCGKKFMLTKEEGKQIESGTKTEILLNELNQKQC